MTGGREDGRARLGQATLECGDVILRDSGARRRLTRRPGQVQIQLRTGRRSGRGARAGGHSSMNEHTEANAHKTQSATSSTRPRTLSSVNIPV